MVQEAREFAGRIRQESPDHKKGADLLEDFARSLGKQGLLPRRLPRVLPETQGRISRNETLVVPELDLDAEWQRQAHKYLGLGYYAELGMTDLEYLESLPKFEPQPEAYKGRLETPLLVETRIDIDRQYELAGVRNWLKESGLEVQNLPEDPKNYQTPENPYTTWANDPAKNRNRKVEDVRKTLAEDERGGTRFDGIAQYIANPAKLEEVFIDLPGDQVESGSAPDLRLFGGRPHLGCHWVDAAAPRWGSLVCGREIEN